MTIIIRTGDLKNNSCLKLYIILMQTSSIYYYHLVLLWLLLPLEQKSLGFLKVYRSLHNKHFSTAIYIYIIFSSLYRTWLKFYGHHVVHCCQFGYKLRWKLEASGHAKNHLGCHICCHDLLITLSNRDYITICCKLTN